MVKHKTINEYIKGYPKDVQLLLMKVRTTIKSAAPKAVETISYGIPTFKLADKNLVHFGGFKKHIGFFPTPSATTAFKKELVGFKVSKGTVRLPLDKPLPLGLIKRITQFRVRAIAEQTKKAK